MKILRKPDWLRIKFGGGENYKQVKHLVEANNLHTICSSGKCPNMGECWNKGTATLMILGYICTRSCKFCATKTGKPLPPDPDEPQKLAQTVRLLKLKHVVITSVDRDDLPDLGALHWTKTIQQVRDHNPNTIIEVLVPDFQAKEELLNMLVFSKPDIISHNIETVRRLTSQIRSKADYDSSLNVLRYFSNGGLLTKSGFMLGFGETHEEILQTIKDVYEAGCRILTIGQYLQPTVNHLPVYEYIHPDSFQFYKDFALKIGFSQVESAPLVRSSYMAEQSFDDLLKNEKKPSFTIQHSVSLKNYHTFHIDVNAAHFIMVSDKNYLREIFSGKQLNLPVFVLGGGSNVIFKQDYQGTVLQMCTKGNAMIRQQGNDVFIQSAAGEEWDSLVDLCCRSGWYGLENLSLIPGTVGASPVQNIGAFGVEAGDRIHSVEVFDMQKNEFFEFSAEECIFGYRNSRFKTDWLNRFIITEVVFKLSLIPIVNLQYDAFQKLFAGRSDVTPAELREAVIEIRRSRLPEADEKGNAGSFFKNPVIPVSLFHTIAQNYPEVVSYPVDDHFVKLAAAWLIEHAGWKGKIHGNAGVHDKQALVIVNNGGATSEEVLQLSEMIQKSVKDLFGVELEREVLVV